MDSGEPPLGPIEGIIILILALTLLSVFFSLSESAILSINKLRLRVWRLKNDKAAIRITKVLEHKDKLLNTFLVGNNIVNITITTLITAGVLALFERHHAFEGSGVGVAAILTTVYLLFFSEIMPKTMGALYPEQTAFALSGLIVFFVRLLSPLTFVFTRISRLAASLLGIPLEAPEVSFTEEEIKTFIDIGGEEGVLEESAKQMMHRVFAFTDLAARDIMTPRTKIVSLSLYATYRETLELAQRSRISCFPVCGDGLDNVLGVFYVRDMLALGRNSEAFSIKKTMREPIFIPGSKKMSAVQQILRQKNQSMAVVMDEYSGTGGLLTTEDIASAIFGKISNDYDAPGRPLITQINQDELVVDGSCRLKALGEQAGIVLSSANYETLGGFMLEQCDRIPQTGDGVTVNGCTFTVMAVAQNRVQKVHILRQSAEGGPR
jgi:CBS domain containing-hemolysin-like protein